MKQLLTSIVAYGLLLFSVQAQHVKPKSLEGYSLRWSQGSIFFHTGDTLHAKLRYNQTAAPQGILQVKQGEHLIVISSLEVKGFVFFDSTKNRVRKFTSLPVPTAEHSGSHYMERLYDDEKFSILNYRTMDVPYGYMNYTRMISKPVPISKKYILNAATGEVLPLSKENALRMLNAKRNEISAYIQDNHLRFKKTTDYISLFQYHNSL